MKKIKFRQLVCLNLFLTLVACQQVSPRKVSTLESDRFQDFSEQLDNQTRLVDELKYQVKLLKEKVAKMEVSQKAVPDPKVPVVKIKPPKEDSVEIEEDDKDDTLIASSQNEALHWFLEGEDNFKAKKYESAINAYHHFLRESEENHPKIEEAQYRLIESYFYNKEYGLTLLNSNRMEAKFPHSKFLPKILALKAECFQVMGNNASQQKTLRELVKKFPQSQEAKKLGQRFAEYKPKSKKDDSKPKLLDKSYRF